MAMFLVKTEPEAYSFDDLARDKRTAWSGVKNPAALGHLRTMKVGDQVLVYHTGDVKAIVGVATVVKAAYEDPEHPGKNERGEPKAAVVDLAFVKPVATVLTLKAIKADRRFANFALVTQSRLSVMSVPPPLAATICELTGI